MAIEFVWHFFYFMLSFQRGETDSVSDTLLRDWLKIEMNCLAAFVKAEGVDLVFLKTYLTLAISQ